MYSYCNGTVVSVLISIEFVREDPTHNPNPLFYSVLGMFNDIHVIHTSYSWPIINSLLIVPARNPLSTLSEQSQGRP